MCALTRGKSGRGSEAYFIRYQISSAAGCCNSGHLQTMVSIAYDFITDAGVKRGHSPCAWKDYLCPRAYSILIIAVIA